MIELNYFLWFIFSRFVLMNNVRMVVMVYLSKLDDCRRSAGRHEKCTNLGFCTYFIQIYILKGFRGVVCRGRVQKFIL